VARIRSIKPEFCSSADTGALSRDARLFFLQLLTEADDEGRLLWIPRRLCGVLYPHDEDVSSALLIAWATQCAARGMVVVYEVDGADYLQVANWKKHQRISHATESRWPAPSTPGARRLLSREADLFGKDSGLVRKNSGEAPENTRSAPEPFRPDLGTGNREQGDKSSLRSDSSTPSALTLAPPPPKDIQQHKAERLALVTDDAIASFNATLGKPVGLLPAVNPAVGRNRRRQQVGRCLRVAREICLDQYGSTLITREFWDSYFGTCAEDEFRSGRAQGGKGHENWTPDFEYLTREAVMVALYDRASSPGQAA
jgi:hypothetical protein